jgi:hypothetical protein
MPFGFEASTRQPCHQRRDHKQRILWGNGSFTRHIIWIDEVNLQQGRTSQAICPVDTTSDLTSGKKTRDRLTLSVENMRRCVNFEPSHRVMEHGSHDSNMEEVVEGEFTAWEELSSRG